MYIAIEYGNAISPNNTIKKTIKIKGDLNFDQQLGQWWQDHLFNINTQFNGYTVFFQFQNNKPTHTQHNLEESDRLSPGFEPMLV